MDALVTLTNTAAPEIGSVRFRTPEKVPVMKPPGGGYELMVIDPDTISWYSLMVDYS
jgi:hypothetical protein